MTTKEKIEVMQAFENGEEIERKTKGFIEADWILTTEPCWNWSCYEYRIKPKAPTRLEVLNDFYEKLTGVKSRFGSDACISRKCEECNTGCDAKILYDYWNQPCNINYLKGGAEE